MAIEDSFYSRALLPELDQFKVEHLGSAAVRLHYRAMALKAGPFKALVDPAVAWAFEQALGRLLGGLDLSVFCAVINKNKYLAKYGPTRPVDEHLPTNLYLMAFDFVLERFVQFLEECGEVRGSILAEARGRTEDAEVAAEYAELLRRGTQFVSGERFRRVLAPDARFASKREGIGGLELADLLAAPIATQVLRPERVSPQWDAIQRKIWQGAGARRGRLGLKCFPRARELDSLFASIGDTRSAGSP